MIGFLLIIAASNVCVLSQRCAMPAYLACTGSYNPYTITRDPYETLPCEGVYLPSNVMPNIPTVVPVAATQEPTVCLQQTVVPEIPLPVSPFITELPNCPDICFNDILSSQLGCLDPILAIYGTNDVCPLPELPVSPLLPAASPVFATASPFSRLLPPVSDCDCHSHFLKRVPIPPPFI